MNNKIDELIKAMEQLLPHKRYVHTLGVAYLAASIAMAYKKNYEKAMVAGLLHDCAKCLPEKEILKQWNYRECGGEKTAVFATWKTWRMVCAAQI